ncbi:LCP family protein [Gordonia sp. TBRC 11910]|uniref:LCP family protein n=1 Tax=Gordonia asplenii TaxID=2725283 RepID=A0A848L123_9ACTN|nr:LCP family protein [Gordonia asplenii]NMO04399.1 LCP family protein [Gordonia asplenii]
MFADRTPPTTSNRSSAPATPDSSAGPPTDRLREPRNRDRYVRNRNRVTVRDLMEQMDATGQLPRVTDEPRAQRPRPAYDPGPVSNDVTTKIPQIVTGSPVDLSDAATAARVIAESRGQGHGRPLQPTPDLPDPIELRSAALRKPKRTRRQMFVRDATIAGRIVVAIACIVALGGAGYVWNYKRSWDGNWNTISAVNPDDANIRNKDAQYGDENYLIVGTDTRTGNNSSVGAGTASDVEGARSDTVILVNVPANRSRVVAVSFPRDLQVDRPQCRDWDNSSGTYGQSMPAETDVKLNSVYAVGGPECLVKLLTEMSGLNINHFIGMDFSGFRKIVDQVGGVEVCSPTPLYDYEIGTVLKKAGKQKLNGRTALRYVRARTISTEGNGDYGRIKRQQKFMSSLLRATLSGNVLSNPSKLNGIVNTFIQNSFVDGVDTQSLLDLADSMQGIEAGRVTFLTIPTSGTSTDGQNNEIPRTDDINNIFNAIIDDQPLPGETKKKAAKNTSAPSSDPAPTTSAPKTTKLSATAMSPGNIGVRVLNGTGKSGLATEVSEKLTPLGFDVRGVADASEQQSTTVVRYGTGEEDAAATLAKMFPGASIQPDHTVKSGVEVILGGDYSGSLSSTPDAGTKLTVTQLPATVGSSDLPNDLAVTNAGDTTCQ